MEKGLISSDYCVRFYNQQKKAPILRSIGKLDRLDESGSQTRAIIVFIQSNLGSMIANINIKACCRLLFNCNNFIH